MTWRTLAAIGAAIAIAIGAIALVAPSHGGSIDPVAQAADTTSAAGTAEFGLAGNINVAGQSIPLNGNGAVDMKNQRMNMSMGFPIPGFGQMQMQEILDGTTIYMKFPDALAQRLPGGKAWMKLDLEALGKSQGIDMKSLTQANQANPTDILAALKAVGSSHVVGQEDVGGTPTTHYAAAIDLNKAAERIPNQQTVDSVKQMFKASGLSSIPVDVWVDRSGRVKQEGVKLSTPQFSMNMTLTFTQFGVPVDTTPPPADQTMDASALLALAGAASGSGSSSSSPFGG